MKRTKKIFKLVLKLIPVLGLAAIIIGVTVHEVHEASYKELSLEEFTKVAVENEVTWYTRIRDGLRMETPSGERYYHLFQSYSEESDFSDMIYRKFEDYSIDTQGPFYYSFIVFILMVVAGLYVFSILILWFITLYDLFKSEFKEIQNKWIWLFGFAIFPIITPVFYLFISDAQKKVE